jgi:peptide-methionine (S)-S-oxide reductase
MSYEDSVIVLAGGCFWCTEAVFGPVRGVLTVESGYSNGEAPSPTYEDVCTGTTGHAEVIRVVYDPRVIGLRDLLQIFFATHDPTTLNRQGADVGTQYRSGIYWTDEAQALTAHELIEELTTEGVFGAPIVTEVEPLRNYHRAEDDHQGFFARHPFHGYCMAVAAPKVHKLRRVFAQWVS